MFFLFSCFYYVKSCCIHVCFEGFCADIFFFRVIHNNIICIALMYHAGMIDNYKLIIILSYWSWRLLLLYEYPILLAIAFSSSKYTSWYSWYSWYIQCHACHNTGHDTSHDTSHDTRDTFHDTGHIMIYTYHDTGHDTHNIILYYFMCYDTV